MWEYWKRKVSNFFFDEIEEEEDAAREEIPPKENEKRSRSVTTKITYQYPKERNVPFRFPVIPDDSQNKHPIKRKSEIGRIPRKRKQQPISSMKMVNNETLIYGYKNNSNEKLENVPAFMRRKKPDPNGPLPQEEENNNLSQQESKDPLAGSTRPEELDRVFRKRDRRDESKPVQANQETDSKKIRNEQLETVEMISEQSAPDYDRDISTFQEELDEKENTSDLLRSMEEVAITEDPFRTQSETESTHAFSDQITVQKERDNEPSYEQKSSHQTINNEMAWENELAHDIPNHLLNDPAEPNNDDAAWFEEQQSLLEQTLTHFNISAKIVNVTQGPSVTRFEIQPALGVKVSRIRNLSDDIKLNMAAKDIRIEAPIPGKNTIGIEVPNQYPQMVTLQEIIETEEFETATSPLSIALGLTIEGEPLITNIGKMPHGLIAGATGSGKSVCINTILLSLLYKARMDEVKFLLIDPKMVELTPYNGIPHLISPVITDPQAATMALKWAVEEMEDRYEKFVEAGVRNIEKYNERMTKQNQDKEKLPYLVIVIDELADLMIVSPQEVEDAICRIAQKARASGIHLLLATQRPSVDVITGLIKANIPTRIAFSVSSQVDSRTIIDSNGAEKLLGKGDMLFIENGGVKRMRLQGPFVSDEEIDRVCNYLRSLGKPNYLFEQEQLLIEVESEEEDELLADVLSFVVEQNQASTSLLQRRFRIGYNRAARLIDTLQNKGIVSAPNGSKPRDVLVSKSQINDYF